MEKTPQIMKAGETPGWQDHVVIDDVTGQEIKGCHYADTVNSYVVRNARDKNGKPYLCDSTPPCLHCLDPDQHDSKRVYDHVRVEVVKGPIRIVRKSDS